MESLFSAEELHNYSEERLLSIILELQQLLVKSQADNEYLMEQIRIANANLYGRKSEKLENIEGQLSFFNEVEDACDLDSSEPDFEEVLKKVKKKKEKGQRETDLKDFPEEPHHHGVSTEELDEIYGAGNWRRLNDEVYKRLRFQPARWIVEVHTVEVYVGKDGLRQDEFTRGKRPKDLLRNSIVTPSLEAAIMNAKYVNAMPLYRIEQEFQRNGVYISRQNMAGWTVKCAQWYLRPLYDLLHRILLTYKVNQCDETPVNVIHTEDPDRCNCYMWVHRSGEFYKDNQIVIYEYQESRSHEKPLEFYKDFQGYLVTDGLEQYHLLEKKLPGIENCNCWTHARRDFSDAIKAIGVKNQSAIKSSIAHQALIRIAAIFKLEDSFKDLSVEERRKKRISSSKPLVDEYFAWVKKTYAEKKLPQKGKTADGLRYSVNQEKYLRRFLEDGNIPLDNSASERAIRPFTVGRKNWVICNTAKGADASAVIYSITETAKLNNLNPYYYLEYILTEIPKYCKWDKEKKAQVIASDADLNYLLPWSKNLPQKCYKPRRE